jgi:hypothetical protein
MLKSVAMGCFKSLFHSFTGDTEENYKSLSQIKRTQSEIWTPDLQNIMHGF